MLGTANKKIGFNQKDLNIFQRTLLIRYALSFHIKKLYLYSIHSACAGNAGDQG